MTLKIQTEKVLHNLRLFCEAAIEQPLKKGPQKVYAIFIDCKTGDFHLSDPEFDKEDLRQRNWKSIRIHVKNGKGKDTAINIEIVGGESDRVFECQDLDPLAYRVMTETFKILEMVALRSHSAKEMEATLIKLSENEDRLLKDTLSGKDLIHEAWHQVDRIEAEQLLKGYPEGTFIFRKDEFATLLETQLSDQLDQPIKCLTLTFIEPSHKVVDLTVVMKEGRFLFYDDDPSLESRSYSNIFDLLETLDLALKIPLLHAA